ncbi:MAG: phage tail protein [Clostridiales bacterium]|nr:phage tail protein [Clostridiales bacterium]
MASSFYGVRVIEEATSAGSPTTAASGIVIAFGTAPIQQVDGTANEIVVANSYDEAVSALGYSDDWDKYTLCEAIYCHFRLYSMSPLLLVNVLDPAAHCTAVEEQTYTLTNDKVELSGDAIADTIVVKGGGATLTAGTDYDVFYEDGNCYIEALTGGAIKNDSLAEITVSYSAVDFEAEDLVSDIIGGYDVNTGKSTGMELMDMAYFKGRVLPDIMIAPGFSQYSEVAAVMAAKATFSTVFRCVCICDLDTTTNLSYQQAVESKAADASFLNEKQILCWPMVALNDQKYHMSTQLASLMSQVDSNNDDVPSRAASNQVMQADSTILADGTEVLLDLTQSNYLRANGIVTAYNFVNGFTAWGVYTAMVTESTDPKDVFINIVRMFNYVANSIILTFWSRIDENLTPRYAESIVDEINIWLNSLASSEHLLGARCALNSDENPTEDLLAGIVRVHIYMTPPTPAQEIDAYVEYDVDYVATAFSTDSE